MKVRLFAGILLLAGCNSIPEPQENASKRGSPEAVVVTQWTSVTELFMEYPPLQVGQTSRFAVHLTDLASFQPLREGRVSVELDYGNGMVERFAANGPSQPGIFGVDVTPARPGRPSMVVRLQSPSAEDSHLLGPASVLGKRETLSQNAAPAGKGHGDEAISFLKEQQWNLDFATRLVGRTSMRESIRVPATIEPRSGGRLVVTAPVSGRLLPSVGLPSLGASVQQDQKLCAIVPLWAGPLDRSSLQLALDEAKLAIESAKRERQRIERLLAVGAVPARRLVEAADLEAVARARLKAAGERMAYFEATRRDEPHNESMLSFEIRSHLAGVVTSLSVTDGARVEEGDVLLAVAATDSVHVSGTVPESQAAVLHRLHGAEIELPGSEAVMPVGNLVSKALVVDPATRTLKATYSADNSKQRLAIGQSVFLRLFTSTAVAAPTVPYSALVDDAGQTVVYVQVGGESFERRPVVPSYRRGAEVQVSNGLSEGERIVSRGAYLLRLATMTADAPEHGHVH